jgi:DNA (cytosine-5)-methyltransferase 1
MDLEEKFRLARTMKANVMHQSGTETAHSLTKRPRRSRSAGYLDLFRNSDFSKCLPRNSPVIQYVDFFAGCGGMSYGFHQGEVATDKVRNVGAFDIDEHANNTYAQNYGVVPSTLNLECATENQITKVMASNGYDSGHPLIVIGCAPCQGFSSHRKKDSRLDKRNSLVGRFGEIAVALNADMIIMENVPDLLASKHEHHFKEFYDIIKRAGYHVTVKIVNMAEFGVPQARFRTLVLASKLFVPSLPPNTFSNGTFTTVRDAISHLPSLKAGETCPIDPLHVTSKHRTETVEILKQVPSDGGSRPYGIGPKCLDRVSGFYDVYGRLSWDKPSITITARCRTPSCGRFAHPEQHRGLSVREASLLQGFPPDFKFIGPFDDKFKQIGNAVPPLFSLQLAKHIFGLLNGLTQPLACEDTSTGKPFKSFSTLIAHVKSKR